VVKEAWEFFTLLLPKRFGFYLMLRIVVGDPYPQNQPTVDEAVQALQDLVWVKSSTPGCSRNGFDGAHDSALSGNAAIENE
jgi:hypothetical protein